jgi:hypothetical protein
MRDRYRFAGITSLVVVVVVATAAVAAATGTSPRHLTFGRGRRRAAVRIIQRVKHP